MFLTTRNWRPVVLLTVLVGSLGLLLTRAVTRLITIPLGTPAVSDTPTALFLNKMEMGNLYANPLKVFNTNVSVPYPPVFYYIWHWLGSGTYVGGLIALVATLLTGVVLYLIAKRVGLGIWSLLASSLFFLSSSIIGWASVPRPDPLALLLSVTGILVFLYRPLWSVPVFVLALFTKESYLVAPLAVGIFMLTQNVKKAVIFGGLYILTVGVVVYVVDRLLPGFFASMILTLKNTPQTNNNYLLRTLWITAVIVCSNGVVLLAILSWFRSKVKWSLVGLWFIVAFIVVLGLSGKWGSSDNYGLELVAISTLLVTAFVGPLVDKMELKLRSRNDKVVPE